MQRLSGYSLQWAEVRRGIMKKILTCIITGLFMVGAIGVTQAAGYNAREDCCTEGPPYNRDFKQGSDISTIVLDKGHPYIEGMGFAPRPKGVRTVVPAVSDSRDWCCEDMSKTEEEMHFEKANKIEPAAGN
jgi:hypothetical protein